MYVIERRHIEDVAYVGEDRDGVALALLAYAYESSPATIALAKFAAYSFASRHDRGFFARHGIS